MAYDDGYYYGLARLICLTVNEADEGKQISVTNGTDTFTGKMLNKQCEFVVPGRDRYTIKMGSFTTTVELSYGECLGVYMDHDHELVKFSDLKNYVQYTDLLDYSAIENTENLAKKGVTAYGFKKLINEVKTFAIQLGNIGTTLDSAVRNISTLITRADSHDTSIASINRQLETDEYNIRTNASDIDVNRKQINKMKEDFQAGVNTIFEAIVKKGVTPTDKSPSACAIAIGKIQTGGSRLVLGYLAPVWDTKEEYWVTVFFTKIMSTDEKITYRDWFEAAAYHRDDSETFSIGSRTNPWMRLTV